MRHISQTRRIDVPSPQFRFLDHFFKRRTWKPATSSGPCQELSTPRKIRYPNRRACHTDVFQGLRHFREDGFTGSGSIRARNSSMPARPNMARLSVFNLLIWPSAWPLLHGSAIAFPTASMSRANIRANSVRA